MRKAYFLLLLVPSAVIYACGGSTNDIDGGSDAASDNTTNQDAAADTGNGSDTGSDGNTSDGGTKDATQDVVFNISCLYPYQCIDGGEPDAAYPPTSGEVCCGTLVLTGTMIQNCSLASLTTQCSAPGSCASNVALSCGTDTIRGCEHAAECTETNYPNCCLFDYGDGGAQFCVSDLFAMGATSCVANGK